MTDALEEALAEFDALEAEALAPDPVANIESELLPANDYASSELAMQSLLNEHREANIHKVQDPELQSVVDELTRISFANIADLYEGRTIWEQCGFDEDGEPQYQMIDRITLKDFTSLPKEITACIQSVKIKAERGGDVVEVKMYDKLVSLEKLMRYHGGYAKENEQKGKANEGLLDMLFGGIAAEGLPIPISNNA